MKTSTLCIKFTAVRNINLFKIFKTKIKTCKQKDENKKQGQNLKINIYNIIKLQNLSNYKNTYIEYVKKNM